MDQLKQDLIKEMGLWEQIETQGWGALPAKDCGRIGGKMSTRLSPNILRKIADSKETQDK
ncbi:MAG: small, acid-soluble spore protein, alpha/beta type [Firmicutes bacterium]|nr:small, acid-soluble spore protein, alpha/beta type [Bacillota bacterium]